MPCGLSGGFMTLVLNMPIVYIHNWVRVGVIREQGEYPLRHKQVGSHYANCEI